MRPHRCGASSTAATWGGATSKVTMAVARAVLAVLTVPVVLMAVTEALQSVVWRRCRSRRRECLSLSGLHRRIERKVCSRQYPRAAVVMRLGFQDTTALMGEFGRRFTRLRVVPVVVAKLLQQWVLAAVVMVVEAAKQVRSFGSSRR